MRLFLHNLFASLQMMLMGIFLGIVPLIGLFTNGALLGSIAAGLATEDIPLLAFMSLGILPHGIFELPAFFISSAFGMKMGFHLVFPLPQKKGGKV
jgi:stage II sporulation protein M